MNDFICELCGAACEGDAAACGSEVCEACCRDCYARDGFCEDLDAKRTKE